MLICFHPIFVDSLNETSSNCDDKEGCVRMCCNWEVDDGSCETLMKSELFQAFRNFTLHGADIKYGVPCEKMQPVDDDDWIFEVNNFKVTLIQS